MLIDNVRRDGVEEGSVVRDDEERMRPRLEVIFQPGESVEIEIVRRLVEEQKIGFAEQRCEVVELVSIAGMHEE